MSHPGASLRATGGRAVSPPRPADPLHRAGQGAPRLEGRGQPAVLLRQPALLGGHGPRRLRDFPHLLRGKVDRLLEGPPLRLALRNRGIEVTTFSAPKQTDTTQRWKVELSVEGQSVPLHTKLEFSRRRNGGEARVEAVDRLLLDAYQLMPLLAPHYPLPEAIRQKIGALIGRTAVQARDVFDLAVLFSRGGSLAAALKPVRQEIPPAIERTMEISYADFRAQVVAFLAPPAVAEYGDASAWEALQASVVA